MRKVFPPASIEQLSRELELFQQQQNERAAAVREQIKAGALVETICRVGDYPAGFQAIIIKQLDSTCDPLILVEARGRRGCVHFSEIKFLGVNFDA